ncbi:glycosyltransferase family 25 protein [Morganella morganii]|uniref:Glycosyltransferase family 25 protein n=1 Tax=Morganella morganii TaxID=582 RepID=A0AAI9HWP1_MORMO|nr:glycosyltransferase family 25 protein [Morganella morganii]EKW8763050.1 glycosyltransferase family 25 protein [Morganella morganii]HDF2341549.1 glycosyltransferase family 25 protein [Morganella morganii]HDF2344693.1 glycosyltransferase family 25 protein [Morganella morganii]
MDLKRFMSDVDFAFDHDFFEKVIYINLASRPDRKFDILEALANIEIPHHKIVCFDAVAKSPGFLGCALSHVAVMKMIIDNDWGPVLVVEDDNNFYYDDEHIRQANVFLSALRERDWDVALLGGNYYHVYEHEPEWYSLKLKYSHCTNAYIVNRGYAETLYQAFSESVCRITAGDEPNESHSIDVVWNELMDKDNWYGLYPCIAYQEAGFSDIRMATLNYEYLFNKPLSDLIFFTRDGHVKKAETSAGADVS